MGIYYSYTPGVRPTPIVPDGFLSIGVPRRRNNKGSLSYVLWEENNIVPLIVLFSVNVIIITKVAPNLLDHKLAYSKKTTEILRILSFLPQQCVT